MTALIFHAISQMFPNKMHLDMLVWCCCCFHARNQVNCQMKERLMRHASTRRWKRLEKREGYEGRVLYWAKIQLTSFGFSAPYMSSKALVSSVLHICFAWAILGVKIGGMARVTATWMISKAPPRKKLKWSVVLMSTEQTEANCKGFIQRIRTNQCTGQAASNNDKHVSRQSWQVCIVISGSTQLSLFFGLLSVQWIYWLRTLW